jgi:hypothetical protein
MIIERDGKKFFGQDEDVIIQEDGTMVIPPKALISLKLYELKTRKKELLDSEAELVLETTDVALLAWAKENSPYVRKLEAVRQKLDEVKEKIACL